MIQRTPGVLCRETGDGNVVMVQPKTGECYQMNDTGHRIWQLIEQPVELAHLSSLLAAISGDVKGDERARDIDAFVQELLGTGLASEVRGDRS